MKKKKSHSLRLSTRVMGFPLVLSSDLQVTALVIGRARGSPADTAVHCAVKLGATVPALSDGETRAFPCQPSAKPDLRS